MLVYSFFLQTTEWLRENFLKLTTYKYIRYTISILHLVKLVKTKPTRWARTSHTIFSSVLDATHASTSRSSPDNREFLAQASPRRAWSARSSTSPWPVVATATEKRVSVTCGWDLFESVIWTHWSSTVGNTDCTETHDKLFTKLKSTAVAQVFEMSIAWRRCRNKTVPPNVLLSTINRAP